MPTRLQEAYQRDVIPALTQEFNYTTPMQVPRLQKVVLNIGMGEAIQNSKALDAAVGDLAAIAGQKPVVTRAKKSIAAFKLRQGMPIGAMVTLRGNSMYNFMDRLINLSLPRIRDFRGISRRSFDGRGNYSLGLREQIIFPEIDYDKVDKIRGLEVAIVTTAVDDAQGYALLKRLGMPFRD
ncbi:MAG TPA: 50S ribosomal protein L5 [Roseiflexaceae bacterium]|nr:50S ribosomal protein L5 [Roseiflexaceae bacterium]